MQAALFGGLCQALIDPRFQSLIAEFHAVRDGVCVDDEPPVRAAVRTLFDAIHDVVYDQNEVMKLTGADDPAVPEMLEGLRCAQAFVLDTAFLDAVTVLCMFRSKLKLTGVLSEEGVLRDLDAFLALLGVSETVSVLGLWERCAADADQRRRIWDAVTGVLYAVRDHCCLAPVAEGGPEVPPGDPAPAAATPVR